MSKLKRVLTGLKQSQEILELLDESGIDIDRLIAISNAQGPQAKMVKDALSHIEADLPHTVGVPIRKSLPAKKKKKS
jgi:hypothetical protein